MPRTRQLRTAEKPKESLVPYNDTDKEAASNFQEFVKTYELKKLELLEKRNATLTAFRLKMKQDRLTIPVSIGNKKIKDLKHSNNSLWENLSTLTSFSLLNSVLHPRNNNHITKNVSNDEGYLTSESSTGTSGGTRYTRTSRRSSSSSRAEASAPVKKPSRASRSLSRSQATETAPVKRERSSRSHSRNTNSSSSSRSTNRFKTPQNTRKLDNFGTVTPKMKPNTAHVVLRRPQQGEIAISLQGSPLMTTAMVTETTANLNIPLPDGRLINIQPRKGLRASEIPELDHDIQMQLQTLRENLDKVCQFIRK